MKSSHSVAIAILSLSMGLAFLFPLWNIQLEAPQYPEGLGMKIWINKLSGDIRTINGLNHYIGMQKIDQDSIPELRLMPWFLGALIITGLLAAYLRRKWVFFAWLILFLVLGTVAGYDFYRWEYDYGHNLDPTAAIKIPGMSYQPPLLGSRQLLNFTAHSYPDAGGYIILLAGMVALLIAFLIIRQRPNNPIKTT